MNILRLRPSCPTFAVARGNRVQALTLAMLSLPTLLHAQEAPNKADQLDEIVVTARFRPESAQNVGESIRVFGNQEMQDLGINSVETLAALTPGLSIQDRGPNRNEISIEGVGRSVFQQDRTLSMASVGLYLDDVPIDIPVGAQLDIPSFDLQRVEVLRGPQGTLFGAGAEAGAVRYLSQNPDLSRFEGTSELAFTSTAGGDLGYAARVAAGIPIIQDQLAVRLVVTQTGDEGYIANLADNDKHSNGYRATTARLVALWKPNEALQSRFLVNYQYAHQNALGNVSDADTASFSTFSTAGNYVDDTSTVLSEHLSYNFGPVSVESISSYFDRKRDRDVFEPVYTGEFGLIGNALGAAADDQVDTIDQMRYSQFSQEFRVVSDPTRFISYVAGAFFRSFHLKESIDYESQDFVEFAPIFANLLGVPTPANPSQFASGLAGQLGLNALYNAPPTDIVYNNGRQLSAFVEGTIHFTDRLRLTAGVRRHHETIDAKSYGAGADYLSTLSPPMTFSASTSADAWLPKFSLEFNPIDNLLLYATYTEGVRDGNLNAASKVALIAKQDPARADEIETFGPEFEKSAQVGIKGSELGNRLMWSVSSYYNWIKSLQGYGTANFEGETVGVIENIGDGHSVGIEAEIRGRPTAGLTLFAGGTRIKSVIDSVYADLVSPVATVAGQRLPFVPNYTLSGGAEWEHKIGASGWDVFASGTESYTGNYSTYFSSPPGSAQNPLLGDYAIANFRLGVRDERWTVDLGVANAFDRRAIVSLSPVQALFTSYGLRLPPGANIDDMQMWRPRTFTLTFRTKF
jgi:iron complex outermembrane recepter protein